MFYFVLFRPKFSFRILTPNCINRDSVPEEEVVVSNSITSGIRRANLKQYAVEHQARIGNEALGKRYVEAILLPLLSDYYIDAFVHLDDSRPDLVEEVCKV